MAEFLDERRNVGVGWQVIIENLHRDLLAIGPYELLQIKEKFGGLRYYIGTETAEQSELINAAEARSLETCENCGHPGKPRSGSWIKTLCDPCSRGREPLED